jgi:hypothetical protein
MLDDGTGDQDALALQVDDVAFAPKGQQALGQWRPHAGQ